MAAIGFIGASGLMGHGMAKNLIAKGHALSLTVHRNRERVADLLAAGAKRVRHARPSSRAASEIVFLCVTGSPQVEASVAGADGPARRRAARPRHRRLLDQRARLDRAPARDERAGRRRCSSTRRSRARRSRPRRASST